MSTSKPVGQFQTVAQHAIQGNVHHQHSPYKHKERPTGKSPYQIANYRHCPVMNRIVNSGSHTWPG
ncbi:MAG: hypothetical protein R6V29_04885 [Spirochaetia bacterium]